MRATQKLQHYCIPIFWCISMLSGFFAQLDAIILAAGFSKRSWERLSRLIQIDPKFGRLSISMQPRYLSHLPHLKEQCRPMQSPE